MAEISMYDPAMLVWVDETGCDERNCQRRHCYSVRGIPPQDHWILVRGVRYSGIPVMSLQGIHDVQIVEGSVNGLKFEEFIVYTLMPILNPFNGTNPLSVVIMDNCSIYHTSFIKHLIKNVAQAKLIFLPPYSPDLMPLEEVFSKVKYTIKESDRLFQTCTAPRPMLALAFTAWLHLKTVYNMCITVDTYYSHYITPYIQFCIATLYTITPIHLLPDFMFFKISMMAVFFSSLLIIPDTLRAFKSCSCL